MMYKCEDCNMCFDEPKSQSEKLGDWDSPVSVCPFCKGVDFEETEKCEHCGEDELKSDVVDGICVYCREQFAKDVEKFLNKYDGKPKEIVYELLDEKIIEKRG